MLFEENETMVVEKTKFIDMTILFSYVINNL